MPLREIAISDIENIKVGHAQDLAGSPAAPLSSAKGRSHRS